MKIDFGVPLTLCIVLKKNSLLTAIDCGSHFPLVYLIKTNTVAEVLMSYLSIKLRSDFPMKYFLIADRNS